MMYRQIFHMRTFRQYLGTLSFWLVLALMVVASFRVQTFINAPQLQAAEECSCPAEQDELTCNKTKQSCWQSKINDKQQQANTLANVISVINGQIVVQELQIKQTKLEIDTLEKEIGELNTRISGLNVSLDRMTDVLIQRVDTNYKRRSTNPLSLLLVSDSIGSFFSRYKYLQIAQKHTAELMQQAETQKTDFDVQKALKEKKQDEVDKKRVLLQQQQNQLTQQRADQQELLKQTQNDEARYQSELAKTLAEEQAVKGIFAGNGSEAKVGEVKKGDKIATIISGASPCSNGTHLHFEVEKDGVHQNPANYLQQIGGLIWNNSPDGPFSFSGGWEWPLNDPARINQGFGMTWYARVRRAYGGAPHTGIDMVSKDGNLNVKAVKDGVAYRGSIKCGNGLLRYVKVDHKDDAGVSSYYLHVNY
jgi:peptidoglycan hydrolase CwlO-like protein